MKKLIYLYLIIITITSCDVLDLKPLDKISETDTWTDPALMQLYVNANYHTIDHGYFRDVLATMGDESFATHNDGAVYTVQKGELTSDNVTSVSRRLNYWSHAYKYIRSINIFFDKIETAPVSDEFKRSTIGEMKFLRAYTYANLIWRYGGVPILTNVFELHQDYAVTRDSYDACVDFIISDLDEAIRLLPARQPSRLTGRASGDACKALKSRVLLYSASLLNNPSNDQAKWQKAADAAAALLDVGYMLYPDYQQLFMKDNDEVIYARYFTQANASDYNMINGRSGSNGSNFHCPSQNMVNAYEMALTGELPYMEQEDGSLLPNPASGYDPENPYEGRDPRFEATILHDGSMWAGRETATYHGGLDSPESSVGGWNASLTAYCMKKFMDESIPPTGSSVRPVNPWTFFRYAEILLNYAEAQFELGNEDLARVYLNKVRSRQSVHMPEINDTGEKLRERIQNERRVELAFEEHRYFDVRRWKIAMKTENKNLLAIDIRKMENGKKTYQIINLVDRSFLEQHYLAPIPRVEIDRSLNTLSQNPGY